MANSPTPDQIAELKAAGYDVIMRVPGWMWWGPDSPHPEPTYFPQQWQAWSAAWDHYQTQRNPA